MMMVFIVFYLILQIYIGYLVSKRIKSENDFFVGNRKVPVWALAFSIFATWFGAETCIGSSAAVFQEGLAGSKAEPIGYGMCLFLTALIIAPRIWNQKFTTLSDYMASRFGKVSEILSVWILIPSGIMWGAAQVRAFGQVISSTTSIDINMAIMIATTFVIIYTFLGGMMGDIVTDVLQGGILAISLVILLVFAFSQVGGVESLAKIDPAKLTFLGEEQTLWAKLDSWLIPIFGSLITQELVARVLAASSAKDAQKSSYMGLGLYLLFGSIPIILGLLGPQLNVALGNETEQFLPELARQLLPSFLYVIFVGSLISAVLSTIDSILLATSALVAHNLIIPKFNITDAGKKLKVARAVIVISGLVSFVIAMYADSVYGLVEEASAFGTNGLVVVVLFGLLTKWGREFTSKWTLVGGLVISMLLTYVFNVEASFTLSLIFTALLYLALAVYEHKYISLEEEAPQAI